ncbi:hypothetical protein ASPCAL02495 [Aspergillus calidoustus]|uniref:PHD-type domain-containing protein n=1 Tax=Aspergillus calidoustus TaxID=454130 RepID=A0A0U5GQG2_ASPCI|nr:hypothetical protein ASPCAL02495 [Aspergillus calidoustus]
MSQQNGVPSSLAPLAAHPTDGTAIRPVITPNSHPSNSSASAFQNLSTVSTSSNRSRPRTIIPKLSAATTELLARLAGNIRGSQPQQQQTLLGNDKTPSSRNGFPVNTSNRNIQGANARRARTMRVSSVFIDLSTPPFVYPTSVDVETPVVTTTPTSVPAPAEPSTALPSDGSSEKPPSLANIAPKPVATPSTPAYVAPRVPIQVQPPAEPQPPSLPPLAPLVPAPTVSTPSNSSVPRAVSAKTVKATSAPRQRAVAGNRKSLSKKRKRGKGSDGEDVIRAGDSSSDESDFTPTATQTKSGRQVNRPSLYVPEPVIPALPKENINPLGPPEKAQDAAKKRRRVSRKGKTTTTTCRHCQRGHSAPRNVIVFCDGCNRAWHQHCHDPPIERDVITVKEKEWLCQECNPVEINIIHPTVVRSNPSLTWNPPIFVPIPPPKAEVGGERFPTLDRRQFLSGLSHATLVELLLSISDKNPTVPMFPENMASLPVSKFPSSQATNHSSGIEPAPTLPVATNNSTSANPTGFAAGNGIATPNPDAPQQRPRGRYQEESSDEESEYEFQEHRLYPRAGNGVRLSALAEDLDILAEDPACPTFSYTLHGPMQASIAGRVSA